MAEDDPRQGLDLHVPQGLALVPGEVADLLLGEADVLDVAPAEPGQAALDLGRRQPVVVAVPPVEPDGQLPDRRVPAPGDVVQDALDRLADLRVRLRRLRLIRPALQPRLHRKSPPGSPPPSPVSPAVGERPGAGASCGILLVEDVGCQGQSRKGSRPLR